PLTPKPEQFRCGGSRVVVSPSRAADLRSADPRAGDREGIAGRERDLAFEADRAEAVLDERPGAGAEDRGLVLAAAASPDTEVADEPTKVQAILDGAQVVREVGPAPDPLAPRRVL